MILSLRKIFIALNSGAHNWQLSAAITLGLFSGFLPFKGLLALAVLLIALILNVNFSLYLLFTAVFAGLGYLFDPFFERIGYAILTSPGMEGLFTSLYNTPLLRWTSYNYTLVTGSLVVSSLIAIPGFFLLNKLILIYREQLGSRLNTWKLTKWMHLFHEEEEQTALFRWWGAGIFGSLLVCIFLVGLVFFDPLVKSALEKGLSYSLQRQVDVGDFKSSFTDLSCLIDEIEISDPENLGQNKLFIESMAFDLAFAPLMEKKLQIDTLKADGLAFNTARKTPAKPYNRKKLTKDDSPKTEKEKKQAFGTDFFKVPAVDDVLKSEELASVEEAQKLQAHVAEVKAKWTKQEADLRSGKDVEQLKTEAARLKKSFEEADISMLPSLQKDVSSLNSKIKTLQAKFGNLQQEFDRDRQGIIDRINKLQTLPQQDVTRLKKKYAPSLSGGANIVSLFLDEKIGTYLKKSLHYYEIAKPFLNDARKQRTKNIPPPRGEGRWIAYANHSKVPRLVIVKGLFGVELEKDIVNVEMSHFSTNQKLYDKPLRINADSKGKSYTKLSLDLTDDRRSDQAKTSFALNIDGLKKTELEFEEIKVADIVSNIEAHGEILGKTVKGKAKAMVRKANISMPSRKTVNDLLANVHSFNIDGNFKGTIEAPEIALSTDLDKKLADGLSKIARQASEEFEAQLLQEVQNKLAGESKGLNADLGDAGKLLASQKGELLNINTNFSQGKTTDKVKGLLGF